MLDITAIILTKDERLHIARCLNNVNRVAKKVYVVDCFSTDGTQEIARSMGAEVIEHEWPGNQAEQFNWALDNLPIDTEWILRLDADEYLTPQLIEELEEFLRAHQMKFRLWYYPSGVRLWAKFSSMALSTE